MINSENIHILARLNKAFRLVSPYSVVLLWVNDQLYAQLRYIIRLFYNNPLHVSSNSVLIIRRSNCINTTSGIVLYLCKWPSGVRVELSLTQNTIPDAVLIQFDLLTMSTELLETCKGL